MRNGNGRKGRRGRKPTGKTATAGAMSIALLNKVRLVGAHLGIGNSAVLDRFALPTLDKILRRLEAGKHVELGEAGA